jgi:hypothetical protein
MDDLHSITIDCWGLWDIGAMGWGGENERGEYGIFSLFDEKYSMVT